MIEAKDRNSKVEQVKENFPSGVCPPYMVLLCSKCFVQRWNNLGKSFMRLFVLFVFLRILWWSQSTYILGCILHNNYVPATGIFGKIGGKCQNLGHVENWLDLSVCFYHLWFCWCLHLMWLVFNNSIRNHFPAFFFYVLRCVFLFPFSSLTKKHVQSFAVISISYYLLSGMGVVVKISIKNMK